MLYSSVAAPENAIELLGAGTDAVVYKAMSSAIDAHIAIKISKPKKDHILLHEIEIMKKLNHPNIVKMVAYRVAQGRIELELELLHDSLYNRFSDFYDQFPYPVRANFLPFRLTPKQLGWMCRHIGSALAYLHNTHKILHGDIKSNNIMTGQRLNFFKLIDLGSARHLPEGVGSRSQYVGSETCMPPECRSNDLDDPDGNDDEEDASLTFAADIYAFGSTLYECITGTHFGENNWSLEENEMLSDNDRKYIYPKVINVINICLDENPMARLTASEIKVLKFE